MCRSSSAFWRPNSRRRSTRPVPLAVTTNLNINFLRKPGARDLIAECRLLKLGKWLAVGEVIIRSDGTEGRWRTSRRPIRSLTANDVAGGYPYTYRISS
jgi:hypothetical protein